MNESNNVKVKKILKGVLIGAIAVFVFFGGFFVGRVTLDKDVKTISYIVSMYKKYYYEETDDIVGVFTSALLDRYSDYYTAEEYSIIKKAYAGQREGIGVSFYSGSNLIASVSGNSPAFNAGVKGGGTVTGIDANLNGQYALMENYDDISAALSQISPNKDFSIRIKYNGKDKFFTLQKKEYTQTYVFYYDENGEYAFTDKSGKMTFERVGDNEAYPLLGKNKTAVIKYVGFEGSQKGIMGSSGQFDEALKKFKADGKKCIILDLRNNGGGQMDILCDVASHFIDRQNGSSDVVSVVKYKDGKVVNYSSESVDYHDYGFEKIVMLGNTGTASASEALMGAVLDYDKKNLASVIVEGYFDGEKTVYRTYGKGIMQTTFPRATVGDAIKLTTAKIFWPTSNTTIHGVGLTPSLAKVYGESAEGSAFSDALSKCS